MAIIVNESGDIFNSRLTPIGKFVVSEGTDACIRLKDGFKMRYNDGIFNYFYSTGKPRDTIKGTIDYDSNKLILNNKNVKTSIDISLIKKKVDSSIILKDIEYCVIYALFVAKVKL